MGHGEKERRRQPDFINKRMRQKNEAKAYINNVGEEMVEYYCLFRNDMPLPTEPQLSEFCHSSEG